MKLSDIQAKDFIARVLPEDARSRFTDEEMLVIVNRAVVAAQILSAEVVHDAYYTEVIPVLGEGKYGSRNGYYNAADKLLTVKLDANKFTQGDVGNLVMFAGGGEVHTAICAHVENENQIRLRGDNLPEHTISTIDHVIMSSSALRGDVLNIATLKPLRLRGMINISISCPGFEISEAGPKEYNSFRRTSQANIHRIIWCKMGDSVYFKRGWAIKVVPAISIVYARTPIPCRTLEDALDLPYGVIMDAAVIIARQLLREQYGMLRDMLATDRYAMELFLKEIYRGHIVSYAAMKAKIELVFG